MLCNGDLYSSSFDHYLIHWDLPALEARIEEMAAMRKEDVMSRRFETYCRLIEEKQNKSKKKGGGKRRR